MAWKRFYDVERRTMRSADAVDVIDREEVSVPSHPTAQTPPDLSTFAARVSRLREFIEQAQTQSAESEVTSAEVAQAGCASIIYHCEKLDPSDPLVREVGERALELGRTLATSAFGRALSELDRLELVARKLDARLAEGVAKTETTLSRQEKIDEYVSREAFGVFLINVERLVFEQASSVEPPNRHGFSVDAFTEEFAEELEAELWPEKHDRWPDEWPDELKVAHGRIDALVAHIFARLAASPQTCAELAAHFASLVEDNLAGVRVKGRKRGAV
jgi:hypothetical protein